MPIIPEIDAPATLEAMTQTDIHNEARAKLLYENKALSLLKQQLHKS